MSQTAKLYDGAGTKIIYNVYDASGALVMIDKKTEKKTTAYITGPIGTLVRIANDVSPHTGTLGPDEVTNLHPDHLGSAQAGTDENGGIAWRLRKGRTVSAHMPNHPSPERAALTLAVAEERRNVIRWI